MTNLPFQTSLNRRQFLGRSAAALALPAIGRAAVAANANPANRITIACIGIGGMGAGHLREFLGHPDVQILAVCDVDRDHLARARDQVNRSYGNTDCRATTDFREILARTDLDAVCIATPDHWHVPISIAAARTGKDIYCEKPLSLTIAQGRRLVDAVRRHARVFQTGSQQRSDRRFRLACELVRNGRLSALHAIDVGIPANNRTCEPAWSPQPVPASLDYDMWLGPAPWAPYHEQRCHYSFRFIRDYSGGQVTNFGAHHLDIVQWALDADESGPVEVTGDGQFPDTGLFNTATHVNFEATYAGGVRVTCRTGQFEITFRGERGSISVSREHIASDPAWLLETPLDPDAIRLPVSRDHKQDFLDAVRTRRRPIADVEIGHRSATLCHLGNLAMLLRRPLRWDPATETFPDDPAANRLLDSPMRAPWHL